MGPFRDQLSQDLQDLSLPNFQQTADDRTDPLFSDHSEDVDLATILGQNWPTHLYLVHWHS